jgi:TetR/AcrR family transcriptional regulator, transcriptional repressor for nem operon
VTARNTDTREEILRIGKQLIQEYGYNAFSYADISCQLEIKNAAVHYHFPAKEDLLLALVDTYIDQYRQMAAQLQAVPLTARQKLEKFIERYSMLVDCNCICIIGSVASDYNTLPESVKEKMMQLVEMVLGMVEKTLQEGKRSGEFSFTESARTQTLMLMTNLAAGVQLARITGKKDYETIRRAILKQLIA